MAVLPTEIRVSFMEPGSVIVSGGKYTSAEVKVKHARTSDEIVTIIKPMKIEEEPKYTSGKKNITLGTAFINHWLEPKTWKPHFKKAANAKERIMLNVYQNWKKHSKEYILKEAVKLYLSDIHVDYNTADITIL